MEHYREPGKLTEGYYCPNCGEACAYNGHMMIWTLQYYCEYYCTSNPDLVVKLNKLNGTYNDDVESRSELSDTHRS